MDINQSIIIGRLTHEPLLKQVGPTVKAELSVACGRKYKDKEETLFIQCEAWGKLAEICQQYLAKGSQVALSGRLKQDRWKDNEGKNQSKIYLVVENMQMLGKGSGSQAQTESDPQEQGDEPF